MALPALGIFAGLGIGVASGAVMNPMQVGMNKLMPVNPADQGTLLTARHRGLIDKPKFAEEMKAFALGEENSELTYNASKMILDTHQVISLYRRGLLGNNAVDNSRLLGEKLADLGIDKSIQPLFVRAAEVIATPQDLIRFLVREVLTPELRKSLELDNEFPEAAIAEFAKIGIGESYARDLWAAHWELPSVQNMTIALHRYPPGSRARWEQEVIDMGLDPDQVQTTTEDISQLLKFADVGTRYRQRVLSTLFSDAGQIQLRWLIRFRFIDYEEAVYRHQRQGLPRPIAEKIAKVVYCVQSITDWRTAIKAGQSTWQDIQEDLTAWQITEPSIVKIVKLKVAPDALGEIQDERGQAKQAILTALELGDSTRPQAKAALKNLGYDDEQASFIIDTHLISVKQAKEKEAKKAGLTKTDIKKLYRNNLLSASEAREKLIALGMSTEAAGLIIDLEGSALGK